VSGSTGLLGQAVGARLRAAGHDVVRLVRSDPATDDAFRWSPARRELDDRALVGCDAVLHLAGESIAGERWSEAKKQRIRDSRTLGTKLLADRMAAARDGPRALVSASAIGFYGERGDDWAHEQDPPGRLFISEVCVDWERSADAAREAGLRVVHPRIGVVLSGRGGALGQMLLPFKLGIGGRVGDGRQFMSWIGLDDVVSLLVFCLEREAVQGPVNAVAPHPVRNAEFTTVLGRVLKRPTVLPVPAFGVKALFGQMGRELLLTSTRVSADRLIGLGFTFDQPTLEPALRAALDG